MNDPFSGIRTILVVGITGSGKSTLCNCLLQIEPESDEAFRESCKTRSETRRFRCKTIGGWKIVDTVGLGDTSATTSAVYRDVADACNECAKTGIAQVLLVTRGRLTKEQLDAFDNISRVLLDENMWAYTTLIRTGYSRFTDSDSCAEDIEDMCEHPVMKEFLPKIGNRVIHVDNQCCFDSSEWQAKRTQSREKVFNHLRRVTDQQPPYMPPPLQKMHDRIQDDLKRAQDQERLQETIQAQIAQIAQLQKKGKASEADLKKKQSLLEQSETVKIEMIQAQQALMEKVAAQLASANRSLQEEKAKVEQLEKKKEADLKREWDQARQHMEVERQRRQDEYFYMHAVSHLKSENKSLQASIVHEREREREREYERERERQERERERQERERLERELERERNKSILSRIFS